MEKVDNTEQFLTQLLCCVPDQWGEKRRIIESAVHIFQPAISQSWAHTHTCCFVAGSCQIVLHFAILGTLYQSRTVMYTTWCFVTVLYSAEVMPCCPVQSSLPITSCASGFSILSFSCVVTVISEQNSPKAYYKQTFLAVKGRSESFRKFIHFCEHRLS